MARVALAQQLHAKVGATVILRVQKPSLLSRGPWRREGQTVALRLKVSSIVSDAAQVDSVCKPASSPKNAFVDLEIAAGSGDWDTGQSFADSQGNEREGDASDSPMY